MKFQTPKGTRDFLPEDMVYRRKITEALVCVYKLYGFKEWDGPAFEYLETLTNKSGEEVANEIYEFQDKAGRNLGLRFELTASIARIIANNPGLKKPFKVFNIGKVWRYERPQAGRFREFLQADTDIFGSSSMTCEVELLLMATVALRKCGLKDFTVLLNNRKVLEAQLRLVGIIDNNQQIEALRALDKLPKIGEDRVRLEFSNRGLSVEKFERLLSFTEVKGNNDQKLEQAYSLLEQDPIGIEGINELREIIKLLGYSEFNCPVEINFYLVRGLDYYTGPIFEICSESERNIGSFAGGGRYDQLVELFGGKSTPAVGISFGVERLIEIIRENVQALDSVPPVKVFVAYASKEMLSFVLKTVQQFRSANISTEYDILGKNLGKQLAYANTNGIPYSFIVFSQKEQKLKEMISGQEISLTPEQVIDKLR